MFEKRPENISSRRTISQLSPARREEGLSLSEATVMPVSTDSSRYAKQFSRLVNQTIWTVESDDTLVTTPERTTAENSTPEDQMNVGLSLVDTSPNLRLDSGLDCLSMTVLGESEDSPIFIMDSSQEKLTINGINRADPIPTLELNKKPLHPFFAPRNKIINSVVHTSPRLRRRKSPEAAYPDSESQHVKGNQTTYSHPLCPFKRRRTNADTNDEERVEKYGLEFLYPRKLEEEVEDPCDSDFLPTTEQEVYFEPNLLQEHPAIERVVNARKSGCRSSSLSGQLWADAWRPRCAKEVLGNKHSAIYLRNWLHTLGIQLNPSKTVTRRTKRNRKRKKQPPVIREVTRKKPRRDGLDGFLVEDDEDEDVGPPLEDNEVELMTYQKGRRHSSRDKMTLSAFGSAEPETIHERLHNTILLTGPPGTGKTAAVFACAKELGWEVFEVYPGIGRRNGVNVDNLVGEVGKNHLVRNRRNDIGQASIGKLPSETEGAGGETEKWASPGGESSEEGEQGVKQLVILLEEVDVLFKDDVNFWPAVTNLIKECRRPVICTCNGEGTSLWNGVIADRGLADASLVPVDELPLQKILYFEPCGPEVGAAYLQSLADAEGYQLPLETLWQIYCDTYELVGADMPQDASAPTAHCELPEYDLRRSIHGVQMECTGKPREAKIDRIGYQEVSYQDEISELMSILDVWSGQRRGEEVIITRRGEDDENGHNILYCQIERMSDRDEEMARAVTRLARGEVPDHADGHVLFRRRQAYENAAVGLRGRGPRHEHEWTEEMALVRAMGRRLLLEGDGGPGRQTRNSKRSGGLEAVLSVRKEELTAACSAMADL